MRRGRRWLVAGGVILALLLAGLTLGASQPWTANHFGYALAGRDGLPTYVFFYGRRYHSPQVCAGAGWRQADMASQNIARCYTQADLTQFKAWPLQSVGTMFTLFGAPHDLLRPVGNAGLPAPIIIADGQDCYVVYPLEGGP
ncbi:MAG TPA: hypothetical protein VF808_06375 [Ktedonobacterales bacterium]